MAKYPIITKSPNPWKIGINSHLIYICGLILISRDQDRGETFKPEDDKVVSA